MSDRTQSVLASCFTAGIGVWLLASPLIISVTSLALVNLVFVGAAVLAVSGVQFFSVSSKPSWINMAIAAWIVIAAFSFTQSALSVLNEVFSALILFMLAAWDAIETDVAHHGYPRISR